MGQKLAIRKGEIMENHSDPCTDTYGNISGKHGVPKAHGLMPFRNNFKIEFPFSLFIATHFLN